MAAQGGVGGGAVSAVGDGAGEGRRRAEAGTIGGVGGADVVGVDALGIGGAALLETGFSAVAKCDALEAALGASGGTRFQADAWVTCAEAYAGIACGAKDGVGGIGIAGLAFVGGGNGFADVVGAEVSCEAEGALGDVASGTSGGLFGADLDAVALAVGGEVDASRASVSIGLTDGASVGAVLEAASVRGGLSADVDAKLSVVAVVSGLARLVKFGAGAVFIDLAVAVVVGSVVAGLGGGFDVACAGGPLAADAGLGAIFADADATGACGACVAGAGLSSGANAASIVDLVVAVVVEVIAADLFCGGFDFVVASAPLTACTNADA